MTIPRGCCGPYRKMDGVVSRLGSCLVTDINNAYPGRIIFRFNGDQGDHRLLRGGDPISVAPGPAPGVEAAEVHRHQAVIVENVLEFTDWVLFPWWLDGMRALGYDLQPMIIDAAELGAAQHRKRWFGVFTQGIAIDLTLPVTRRPTRRTSSTRTSAGRSPGGCTSMIKSSSSPSRTCRTWWSCSRGSGVDHGDHARSLSPICTALKSRGNSRSTASFGSGTGYSRGSTRSRSGARR